MLISAFVSAATFCIGLLDACVTVRFHDPDSFCSSRPGVPGRAESAGRWTWPGLERAFVRSFVCACWFESVGECGGAAATSRVSYARRTHCQSVDLGDCVVKGRMDGRTGGRMRSCNVGGAPPHGSFCKPGVISRVLFATSGGRLPHTTTATTSVVPFVCTSRHTCCLLYTSPSPRDRG